MALKYTLIDSGGASHGVDTDLVAAGGTLLINNEAGTAALLSVDVSGYTVQVKGAGALHAGTGATDLILAASSNDIVIWDSALLSGVAYDVPTGDRHRLEYASATVAFEQFDLAGGNDILDLTYAAATAAGIASPGVYGFAATAWGNAGNDILAGSAGGDRLYGDGSSGTAAPTPGSDVLFGGAGNDTLFGDNGSTDPDQTVGGNDTLFDGTGNDTLFGEGGDDSIQGDSGIDTFYGGGGNDTINSGEGDDDLTYGGAGNDYLVGADLAYGGSGDDTIDGGVSLGTGIDILYGDGGDDTLFGRNSNDTLYGGSGADSVDGGAGSDIIYVGSDSISAGATTIDAWDGDFGSPAIQVVVAAGSNFNFDTVDGGLDSGDVTDPDSDHGVADTLVMAMDPAAPRNVLNYTALGSGAIVLSNIEAIVATVGADLINLTYTSAGTNFSYDQALLIDAQRGDDIVFSGAGFDTILGDGAAPVLGQAPGSDLLFGGGGGDIVYGDYATEVAPGAELGGTDTLYGGFGNDTLYGGAGNDTIRDSDGADAYGGAGADLLNLHYFNGGSFMVDGGLDAAGDGADVVVISGIFDTISSSLGAGDDVYISGAVPESGAETTGLSTDIVFGDSGNDVISTFDGSDTLFGGPGNDVLWGGASNLGNGPDVIYGGTGDDAIYLGGGGGYLAYGGEGDDTYYWGSTYRDSNAQIFEISDGAPNYLVVFGQFDENDVADEGHPGIDFLANGFGVAQISHDLMNPDTEIGDPLVLTDNGDGTWTLASTFIPNSSITFDPHDITTIVLWNNDALDSAVWPAGTPVLTFYNWDGTGYVYSDHPN